jgi:spermidine synthase
MQTLNYRLYALMFLGFTAASCSMVYELLIAQMLGQFTNQLITWQCISIGVYLGGLGLGAWRADLIANSNSQQRFVTVETTLTFLGALLIAYICSMHILYRALLYVPLKSNQITILFFTLTCELMALAIGYFSGMEIPIIAAIWKQEHKTSTISAAKSTSIILGVSYFGAFFGSLLFSIWLYPNFHYVKTTMIAALLNFISAFIFIACFKPQLKVRQLIYLFLTGGLIYFMIPFSDKIYNYTIQNYYYGLQLNSYKYFPILLERINNSPPVEQIITPLQTIDIVYSSPEIDLPFTNHNPEVIPYKLYLDQRLQYFSADEYTYHETMTHVPFQLSGKIPKNVLILGGGDGLLIRELLKYSEIDSITLVELDSTMLKIASQSPLLYKLNKNSLSHPKVKIINGDAFYFTRHTKEKFDTIFADFPWPFQYDLAKLYSVEFYSQLKKILTPEGFLVLDFPILKMIEGFEKYVDIMISTLNAAGFKNNKSIHLNKESFLYAQNSKTPLNFNYHKPPFDLLIPLEENLKELQTTFALQSPKENPGINSIFKPLILNIVDPRF